MTGIIETEAWTSLQSHFEEMASIHMRELFAKDDQRFDRFSLELPGLLLDYSKNRITSETLDRLIDVARAADVEGWRDRMFAGEKINATENRAAFHVALRNRSGDPMTVGGKDVMPDVRRVLDRMRAFAVSVRGGIWKGSTGKAVTDVVNIGIGGSDLGPAAIAQALKPYWKDDLRAHFVSNVDVTHLEETLWDLNPETTLFIVVSKTFSTQETMANAETARHWLTDRLGKGAVAKHFVAVSANAAKVRMFGIDAANMFEFWDWVGGRFSVWSAVGLSVALAVGMDAFEDFLAGGHEMDRHFKEAPLERNMPVVLALLGIWYRNFFDAPAHAVLPYDQSLARFPAHLQQLDMESNGKSVTRSGDKSPVKTGAVLFGEPGTNGQHSFHQALHQGTEMVPCDVIVPVNSHNPVGRHQAMLAANAFAQTQALMAGRTEQEVRAEMTEQGLSQAVIDKLAPHRVFEGNRPSNTLLIDRLTPRTLGMLLALYEHKIFVQGIVWNINSFDQWGVELGKKLACSILADLTDEAHATKQDSSTAGLIETFKGQREPR